MHVTGWWSSSVGQHLHSSFTPTPRIVAIIHRLWEILNYLLLKNLTVPGVSTG